YGLPLRYGIDHRKLNGEQRDVIVLLIPFEHALNKVLQHLLWITHDLRRSRRHHSDEFVESGIDRPFAVLNQSIGIKGPGVTGLCEEFVVSPFGAGPSGVSGSLSSREGPRYRPMLDVVRSRPRATRRRGARRSSAAARPRAVRRWNTRVRRSPTRW